MYSDIHLAAPRFAQYCHRCLRFADSSIVSLNGKKIVQPCREIRQVMEHFFTHLDRKKLGTRIGDKSKYLKKEDWDLHAASEHQQKKFQCDKTGLIQNLMPPFENYCVCLLLPGAYIILSRNSSFFCLPNFLIQLSHTVRKSENLEPKVSSSYSKISQLHFKV